ncbi:hypothetical protein GCM10010307_72700 [Streptomyces vastus]|uniref:GNAT family N-acetyltransferase n=1 Tax=Streptomyces vastus TaxID=285451 RepID=A0ABN3RPP0_9ACTN
MRCAQRALDVWGVLQTVDIATGHAQADNVISAKDSSALITLKRVGVRVPGVVADSGLCRTLQSVDHVERAGVITIDLSVPGVCRRRGEPRPVGKLFMISVDAWASGAGTVTLHTFSDAWMSHDLRGHKQPEVQEENAPRLSSALSSITRLTEAEIIPGDPTSYGIPTVDGFEDLPDEDPDLLDSWYRFEAPHRSERLREQLPSDAVQFETETDSPVEFVEVALEGNVVGYVWAADSDHAAGYEPRTPAGDVALDAGAAWLTRLSDTRKRGLSPSQALRELASWTGDSQSGTVVQGSQRAAPTLENLQDLSGRE